MYVWVDCLVSYTKLANLIKGTPVRQYNTTNGEFQLLWIQILFMLFGELAVWIRFVLLSLL